MGRRRLRGLKVSALRKGHRDESAGPAMDPASGSHRRLCLMLFAVMLFTIATAVSVSNGLVHPRSSAASPIALGRSLSSDMGKRTAEATASNARSVTDGMAPRDSEQSAQFSAVRPNGSGQAMPFDMGERTAEGDSAAASVTDGMAPRHSVQSAQSSPELGRTLSLDIAERTAELDPAAGSDTDGRVPAQPAGPRTALGEALETGEPMAELESAAHDSALSSHGHPIRILTSALDVTVTQSDASELAATSGSTPLPAGDPAGAAGSGSESIESVTESASGSLGASSSEDHGSSGRGGGLVWDHWTLPPDLLAHFPDKTGSRLDPSRFHLIVKLLTYDRLVPTIRFINSLLKVDFMGDQVTFEVYVDHPFSSKSGWGDLTRAEQDGRLEGRKAMLRMLDSVDWPHGEMRIHAREVNSGMQPQWLEAWWPRDVNEFAFVAEDDMEVSPFMYEYFKRMVMFYYYNQSNFDPRVYGISFQRQWQVPGINGRRMVYPDQMWLNPLVGTWGQFLFPIQWRQFRTWYEANRFDEHRDPSIGKMITTLWWRAKGNKIWTTWHIRWAYVNHMYSFYTGFPPNMSLSVSHRTSGSNYNKTLGPDADLITPAHLPPGVIRAVDSLGIPTGAPIQKLPPDVPAWWTDMPPSDRILKYDYCMRRLPSRRTPARSLQELRSLLPMFGAEKAITVVPVPGSAVGYRQARNWICHSEGLDRHNHVFLFSLMPLEPGTGADASCKAQAERWNSQAEVAASDLAARGQLVYVMPAAQGAVLERGGLCSPAAWGAAKGALLSRDQAGVVSELLGWGVDVLMSSLGALYNRDPYLCFRQFRKGSAAMATWLFDGAKRRTGNPRFGDAKSLVIRIQASAKGRAAWTRFMKSWRTVGQGAEHLALLPPKMYRRLGAVSAVYVLGMRRDEATNAPHFSTCVQTGYQNKSRKSGFVWWFGPLGAPGMIMTQNDMHETRKRYWALEDVYHSCKVVVCRKTRSS